MSKLLFLFLLSIGLLLPQKGAAQNFDLPSVAPGDIVSANVFNDAFSSLETALNGFSAPTDLLGSWSCTIYSTSSNCLSSPQYTKDASGLYASAQTTVTFLDNRNGSFAFTSSPNSPGAFCHLPPEQGRDGEYTVLRNRLVVKFSVLDFSAMTTVEKISDNKFVWNIPFVQPPSTVVECDRQHVPPAAPSGLTVTSSGLTITLAWTDNSDQETVFTILRKQSLEDQFTELIMIEANATSFTDTVAPGTYWYRVVATNANGDSGGSNVIRITVREPVTETVVPATPKKNL